MAQIRRIVIRGFKSIKNLDLQLGGRNILIGANGAGKSNFISLFKMLSELVDGRLQQFVAVNGRAQSILHFGPKTTSELGLELDLVVDESRPAADEFDCVRWRLETAAGDTLSFIEETISRKHFLSEDALGLGSGHIESRIAEVSNHPKPGMPATRASAGRLTRFLRSCRVYHFHDTSPSARIKQYRYVNDNRVLAGDAANLAPLLLRLRNENGGNAYRRIVTTVRLVAPYFEDFVLEPSGVGPDVILSWREIGSDLVFGPHQLSDGTLRAICLITLLMQPESDLPAIVVIDEPELGLHPYALNVIGDLIHRASHHVQIVASTQSSALLDRFEPEDVIVVDRDGRESRFARLNRPSLSNWLDEYSLGELWEKNVLGGGPH